MADHEEVGTKRPSSSQDETRQSPGASTTLADIQRKASLPGADVGDAFTVAGQSFTRTGPRSAKCNSDNCLTPKGYIFGVLSYTLTHFKQHAEACIRKAAILKWKWPLPGQATRT